MELAPLGDTGEIPVALADVMGVVLQAQGKSTKQQQLDYLSERQILLVLDNFEYLLEGAELVNAILRNATVVNILVTSRERLRLSGKNVFDLADMSFPARRRWLTSSKSTVPSSFLRKAPDAPMRPLCSTTATTRT